MNEIITKSERAEFRDELIERHGFVRAKYFAWNEYRNGLITWARKNAMTVLFQSDRLNALNYCTIDIKEIEAGMWTLIYTPDLETFYRVGGEANGSDDTTAAGD